MTRRQVLDVGDRVQCLPGGRYMLGTITFIDENRAQQPGEVTVTWDRDDQSGNGPFTQEGWTTGDLERLGGDLQLGDWARVEGECRSAQTGNTSVDLDGDVVLLVDTCTDEFGDEIFLVFRREMPSINAIAVPTQLNRITRAEALA